MKQSSHSATDALHLRHAVRMAYLMMLVGVAYLSSSIPLFIVLHRAWWLVAAHILDAFLLLILFVYLHVTQRVTQVIWAICAIDVIAIVPLVLDTGIGRTGLLTVTGALLVIFLLKGRQGIKFWTVFAYVPFVLALVLHKLGAIPLAYTDIQYSYFLAMEALAMAVLWLYSGQKEKADRELLERTKELEAAKASVEHIVQKRTHELAESKAELNSAIQSLSTIGLMMVNPHGKTLIKNRAIDGVLGYDGEWTLEHLAKDLGKEVDLLQECHRVLHSSTTSIVPEVTFGTRILRIGINPVFSADESIGVLLSVQDITEQKVLERSKDEFFAIASHELRTPLTAIRGNMSMIKDYYPDVMKDTSLATMVDDAHAASTRLITIVNDFLDVSKLEQGKVVYQLEPVDLHALISSARRDLLPIFKAHKNTVHLEGLEGMPPVLVDAGRLRQIITNLLGNANTYTKTGEISISGTHNEHMVFLRVTDTGKGIPKDHQNLLFHKFQQAGDNILTRDNTKGTGLGLYISHLLATQMNGDLQLESSEPDKGTTFLVTLPIATPRKS